jgi:signal transduction histidine kinase
MRPHPARWLGDQWVTLCVLAGAVTAVYVVVVLGGGLLIGHTQSPHVGLSVLATAIVALGFEPMRSRVAAGVARRTHGARATPYDVLSRFSESVSGDGPEHADIPLRMARLLAEGTGAQWAQVWLVAETEPKLAASWPPGAGNPGSATGADGPPPRSLDVMLNGVRLGVLRLRERDDGSLSPVEARLFADLAAQAGLVLRGAQLRVELAQRADDLGTLADELQASRRRVVDAHDAERRRLERDIHDGAQQHLVALVVNLRLAQTLAARAPERAAAVLAEQSAAVDSAIGTLVELSRGIYPMILAEEGVAAAVRGVVSTSATRVIVTDHGLGRHPEDIEAALYFCCVEAVQNAVKHASASLVEVDLDAIGGRVTLRVRDDGVGFDRAGVWAAGGLGNMRDRVDSVGGELAVRDHDGRGTEVLASVPVPAALGLG